MMTSTKGSPGPPPHLAAARAQLAGALRTYGRERLELEFRLGHRAHGKFVPGVSEAGWERLKARLDAAAAKGTSVREVVVVEQRELLSDDGSGAKYVIPVDTGGPPAGAPYWMHKKRLADVDDVGVDTGSPWSCRCSVSLEEIDPPRRQRPAPAPGAHRFERHKRRWSYKYRCWSLDLTRVTSNLPDQLDNDSVSYEVEIELEDTAELFCRHADNLMEWAWTLVLDACAMAQGGEPSCATAAPLPKRHAPPPKRRMTRHAQLGARC